MQEMFAKMANVALFESNLFLTNGLYHLKALYS